MESYTLSVGSGQGTIGDGASNTITREINNFHNTTYIYQAPTNITTNTTATITITPTQQKLLTTTSSKTVTSSKEIQVVQ